MEFSAVMLCCGGRVINCLMSSVDKPEMTDDCKNSLMEVFYFISRDFKYVYEYYYAFYLNIFWRCSLDMFVCSSVVFIFAFVIIIGRYCFICLSPFSDCVL